MARMTSWPSVLRAVIFDLDDTLVLSTVNYSKFKLLVIERIASHGQRRADYNPGETIVDILSRFERKMRESGVPPEEMRRRMAEMDAIMDSVELENVSMTSAIPGAAEVLALLRRKGVRVGVLTRGCHAYATAALDRAGILGLVDEIGCRNSNTRPKPDPEAYVMLAHSLGVNKEDTIFVGDHPIDAKCAQNAGVAFVGVGTGDVPKEILVAAGAIAFFSDVGQMLDWLRTRLSD